MEKVHPKLTNVQFSQDANTFQFIDRCTEEKAIYSLFGDNRRNMYEVSEDVQSLAQGVACLILTPDHIQKEQNAYILKGDSLAERKGLGTLGPKVRFAKEPSIGKGTAFLVSPHLALTAGHCVCKKGENTVDPEKVAKTHLVFGFWMHSATEWEKSVKPENVRSFTVLNFLNKGENGDWALLKLSEEVNHIKPLAVNFTNIVMGTPSIYMLGHPSGLPLKYAEKGEVKIVTGKERFQAQITAYAGNSGSPVFDKETQKVIGILVAGNRDFSGISGNASDHVVTPLEIFDKGYEKCQRTSSLPQTVVELISPQEAKERSEADALHNKAIECIQKGQVTTAFEFFVQSGNLGLHQSYFRAVALSPGGQLSPQDAMAHSKQFFNFLKSTEASAEGIKLEESANVFVISQTGGKASSEGSHYGAGSKGMITAKDGGQSYAQGVTVSEKGRIQTASGSKGIAKADKAQIGKSATLVVISNDDEKAKDADRRAQENFWS